MNVFSLIGPDSFLQNLPAFLTQTLCLLNMVNKVFALSSFKIFTFVKLFLCNLD